MSRRRLLRPLGIAAAAVLSLAPMAGRAGAVAADLPKATSNDFVTNLVGPPKNAPLAGDQLEQRTEKLAREVRCPVCQGSSIGDSPSSTARHMKDQVRDLLAAGYSDDQIVTYFEASYGEFIRLAPKAEGFNTLIWIAPALLLFLGAGATAVWLRKRSRRAGLDAAAPAGPEVPSQDPELDPWLQQVRSLVAEGREEALGESR